MKKGQFALEFVILISFTIFFTAMFLVVIQKSYVESQNVKRGEEVGQIMRIISTEVDLADTSPTGYTRTFYIPTNINGADYKLKLIDGWDVVFEYGEKTYVFFLETELDKVHCDNINVGCLLKPGFNTVRKDCPTGPSTGCTLTLLQST